MNKKHKHEQPKMEENKTTQPQAEEQVQSGQQAQTEKNEQKEQTEQAEQAQPEAATEPQQEQPQEDVAALRARIVELEDKNLRMMAEFDNYRRRTNKEKLDLMQTAGEKIFTEMLSLIDDFERANSAMQKTEDVKSLREGLNLIYQKFITFLGKHDVHAIETKDADFNTDEHEAITTFAAGEDKKGKVVDCTQKGYKLGDKVIRFAKVVVGE